MRHLRRIFENRPTHTLELEDFEDHFLEILDIGYKIHGFQKSWIESDGLHVLHHTRPTDNSVIGYDMILLYETEDHPDPTSLSQIQKESERSSLFFNKIISCLKSIESRVGKIYIIRFNSIYNLTVAVTEKSKNSPITVDQSEVDFYEFIYKVGSQLSENMQREGNNPDYVVEEENVDTKTIRIKFAEHVTRSRFNTAVKNIQFLETGVKGFRRYTRTLYNFELSQNFGKRVVELKFKNKKNGNIAELR